MHDQLQRERREAAWLQPARHLCAADFALLGFRARGVSSITAESAAAHRRDELVGSGQGRNDQPCGAGRSEVADGARVTLRRSLCHRKRALWTTKSRQHNMSKTASARLIEIDLDSSCTTARRRPLSNCPQRTSCNGPRRTQQNMAMCFHEIVVYLRAIPAAVSVVELAGNAVAQVNQHRRGGQHCDEQASTSEQWEQTERASRTQKARPTSKGRGDASLQIHIRVGRQHDAERCTTHDTRREGVRLLLSTHKFPHNRVPSNVYCPWLSVPLRKQHILLRLPSEQQESETNLEAPTKLAPLSAMASLIVEVKSTVTT